MRYYPAVWQNIVGYAFTGTSPPIARGLLQRVRSLPYLGRRKPNRGHSSTIQPSYSSMTIVVPPIPSRTRRLRKQARKIKKLRRATILGTGSCVPSRVIENDYFSRDLGIDTTPEWIESRIGIISRYWAVEESSTDLAAGAAQAALEQAGLTATDIDVIIVATSTPDFTMPSTACLVQGRLGAGRALAFDIVNACAGYVFALDAATRYLRGSDFQNALVIGVDRGSRLVNPLHRATSVFFGDGAGALVISNQGTGRVLASKLCSQGSSEPL